MMHRKYHKITTIEHINCKRVNSTLKSGNEEQNH